MHGQRVCKGHLYKQCFKYISVVLLLSGAAFSIYTLSWHYSLGPKNVAPFSLIARTQYMSDNQPPQQHVYYLKTHKTGSDTMCSIFADYTKTHHLLPLLPQTINFNQNGIFKKKQVKLIDGVDKYDMVFNHHVFTLEMFQYLQDDTFTVTSLREPFSNFVSAFNFYRYKWNVGYLLKVPGDDLITEFLSFPHKYEAVGYKSYTNNRQSMDLGFDLSHRFDNIQYIRHFINIKEHQFDLVLIMEYFDEGLILMKRTLRWATQDILYFRKNLGTYEKQVKQKSDSEALQRQLHARFSQADVMLYDHFLNIFKGKMKQAVGLKEETAEFRRILQKLWDFCGASAHSSSSLVIPAGKWNEGFTITRDKCKWQGFGCDEITKILQRDFFEEV